MLDLRISDAKGIKLGQLFPHDLCAERLAVEPYKALEEVLGERVDESDSADLYQVLNTRLCNLIVSQ